MLKGTESSFLAFPGVRERGRKAGERLEQAWALQTSSGSEEKQKSPVYIYCVSSTPLEKWRAAGSTLLFKSGSTKSLPQSQSHSKLVRLITSMRGREKNQEFIKRHLRNWIHGFSKGELAAEEERAAALFWDEFHVPEIAGLRCSRMSCDLVLPWPLGITRSPSSSTTPALSASPSAWLRQCLPESKFQLLGNV